MERVDSAIIGGGVVGLATAWAVARRGHSVCLLERGPRPGLATSTHNSQVIHAGIYYPPGSLKALHCVAGARMLYDFCERYNVPHRRCGKLIVATEAPELESLQQLKARGDTNGVNGLELVDPAFITRREPRIRGIAALFSPHSGVVDAEALVTTLARLCTDAGVAVLAGTPAIAAAPGDDGIQLQTPAETFTANTVVNAAGLYGDVVSAMLDAEAFRIYPCRGEYAELIPSRRELIQGLVYPLPHRHSLGVHFARTVHGTVTLGPSAAFQDARDDYETGRLPLEAFLEPARQLLPDLTLADIRLGGSGIRPKLHGPDASYSDFVIRRDVRNERVVLAAGIESPGLTACLSIGERVAALVAEAL